MDIQALKGMVMKFALNTEIFNEQLLKMVALAKLPTPQPITLAGLLSSMLITGVAEERASGDVKAKRFALLCRISTAVEAGGYLAMTVDELSLLNTLADSNCPTLVHGRLKEILSAPETK
jgi:hypothetical protein